MAMDTAAGTITNLSGEVTAENADGVRTLALGDEVFSGDSLTTGPDSAVEVEFQDGTKLSQGPDALFTIDSYAYDPDAADSSGFLFDLTQGTYRMVTGSIADDNPDGVKVKSPLATMGIRGTTTVHKIGPDGSESHGAEDLTGGRSIILTDTFGRSVVISFPMGLVDVAPGQPMGAVRVMSPEELDSFVSVISAILPATSETGQDEADEGGEDGGDDNGDDTGDDGGEDGGDDEGDDEGDGEGDGEGLGEPLGGDTQVLLQVDAQELVDALSDLGDTDEEEGGEDFQDIIEGLQNLAGIGAERGSENPDDDDDDLEDDLRDLFDSLTGDDTLPGGGDDTLAPATLTGTPGDDALVAISGEDYTIYGLGGNDTIFAYSGADEAHGGEGNDWLFTGLGSPDTLYGEAGDDILIANDVLLDTLAGQSPQPLAISVSGQAHYLVGGGGDDSIQGGSGNEHLLGDQGEDTILGGGGADYISGGDDGDRLYGSSYLDTLIGDTMDGGDTIDGGAGDDRIYGGMGDDLLFGGAGNDTMDGGGGTDTLGFGESTEHGIEVYYSGNLSIFSDGYGDGNSGESAEGFEWIQGTGYGDRLSIFAAGMNFDGGEGMDTLVVDDTVSDIAWNSGTGTVSWGGKTMDITNVEAIQSAGSYDDKIDMTGQGDVDNAVWAGGGSDTVLGGAGDDSLYGGQDMDSILGGDGADWLYGGAGSDTLDSSDTLDGGAGNDTLSGMAGGDTLYGGHGSDCIEGGDGDDEIYGSSENDTASGDALDGGDMLFGGAGNDTLYSGVGDDLIKGNDGLDWVEGGSGNDTLYGDGSGQQNDNDTVSGGDGNDLIFGGNGSDSLVGGDGDDTLSFGDATGGADLAYTQNGGLFVNNDGYGNTDAAAKEFEWVWGTDQNDAMTFASGAKGGPGFDGGGGMDTLVVDDTVLGATWSGTSGTLSVDDGSGAWQVELDNVEAFVFNASDDQLDLTGQGDVDNAVWAGDGADAIDGGAGDDTLLGEAGNDSLDGNCGDDSIVGGDGNDTIAGGDGADRIFGNDGDDCITGGVGNDFINAGLGADSVDGGDGIDTLALDGPVASSSWSGTSGTIDWGDGASVDVTDVEAFVGSFSTDTLDLTGQGTVDNRVWGGGGADSIRGGAGNDLIFGGAGSDTLDGGAGIDTLSFLDAIAGATLMLDGGINVSNDGTGTSDSVGGFEWVQGTSHDDNFGVTAFDIDIDGADGADTLSLLSDKIVSITWADSVGTVSMQSGVSFQMTNVENIVMATEDTSAAADDVIDMRGQGDVDNGVWGGLGHDCLYGGDGNDCLYGEDGEDTLYGGDGDDTLYGGDGNDTLYGGDGDDWLYGGDVEVLSDGADAIYGDGGADTLWGAVGNDSLFGGDGDDVLFGGDGDDLLEGGLGADTIDGGEGDDYIYLTDLEENVFDVVENFGVEQDHLVLNATDFSWMATDTHHPSDMVPLTGVAGTWVRNVASITANMTHSKFYFIGAGDDAGKLMADVDGGTGEFLTIAMVTAQGQALSSLYESDILIIGAVVNI